MDLRHLLLISSVFVALPFTASADDASKEAAKIEQARVHELKKLEEAAKRDLAEIERESAKDISEMEREAQKQSQE
ncbi:hypothetical protein [Grimontia sp. SpTr1]|nr:hypothetical protein [Grimontia sp. SpTr1]